MNRFLGFWILFSIKISAQLLAQPLLSLRLSHSRRVCVHVCVIHCLTHLWSVTKFIIEFFVEYGRQNDYVMIKIIWIFVFFRDCYYKSRFFHLLFVFECIRPMLASSFAFFIVLFLFSYVYPINLSSFCSIKKRFLASHEGERLRAFMHDWSVSVLQRILERIAALKNLLFVTPNPMRFYLWFIIFSDCIVCEILLIG